MIPASRGVLLEARFAPGPRNELVVLCHPHPLFGGTMDNAVVLLLRDALWQAGFGTLRYNFRGVGQSRGPYEEAAGEVEDLRVLLRMLAGHEHARDGLHLGGYSFGAWIAVQACDPGLEPKTLLLVSPPLDFLSFRGATLHTPSCLVVAGDSDSLCSLASLKRWLRDTPADCAPELVVLPECNHFFTSGLDALRAAVSAFFGAPGDWQS